MRIAPKVVCLRKLKFDIESETDDKRVPLALASKVMGDVQSLLYHAGGYLVSKEMRLQGYPSKELLNKFTLYVGTPGAESIDSSTTKPSTAGFGNVVDEAADLVKEILDNMGGPGAGPWADDRFTHPIYRNQIVADVVSLDEHLSEYPGYSLTYGREGDMERFGGVDVDKLLEYVKKRGRIGAGTALGMLKVTETRKGNAIALDTGDGMARITFFDANSRAAAETHADSGPVILSGELSYSKDNLLVEITRAGSVTPLNEIGFSRMVSMDGDVKLKSPVRATVGFDGGTWVLRNDDLGIISSKPDWDSAVRSFHDYFVFLWNQYFVAPGGDLDEEGLEVKEALSAFVE